MFRIYGHGIDAVHQAPTRYYGIGHSNVGYAIYRVIDPDLQRLHGGAAYLRTLVVTHSDVDLCNR